MADGKEGGTHKTKKKAKTMIAAFGVLSIHLCSCRAGSCCELDRTSPEKNSIE